VVKTTNFGSITGKKIENSEFRVWVLKISAAQIRADFFPEVDAAAAFKISNI